MTATSQRTDFMPMEEFVKRAREQIARGDRPIGETMMLTVKFDTNFDRFAANVAYELRHLVVYRTDGGHFARGLVRQTGQLALIHRDMVRSLMPNGMKVRLAARLFRRANADPRLRWMMSVLFSKPVVNFSEAEDVGATPAVAAQAEKKLAEQVLFQASIILEVHWSGDRALRIKDWLKLAEQVGYPGFLDLWYYNRVAVFEYVNWDTTEGRRKAMTASTGGNLPFDGTTGSMSGTGTFSAPPDTPWRNYPFRTMMNKCRGQSNVMDCHGMIGNELRFAENEILQSIADMAKQIKRVGPAAGTDFTSVSGSTADSISPLAGKFYRDVKARLTNPNTLYATYMKYTQDTSNIPIW